MAILIHAQGLNFHPIALCSISPGFWMRFSSFRTDAPTLDAADVHKRSEVGQVDHQAVKTAPSSSVEKSSLLRACRISREAACSDRMRRLRAVDFTDLGHDGLADQRLIRAPPVIPIAVLQAITTKLVNLGTNLRNWPTLVQDATLVEADDPRLTASCEPGADPW